LTPDDPGTADPRSTARPGLSTFTIEGRRAPALFVIGWLASILGGGILFIGFQAPRSAGASLLILAALALLSVGLVSAAGSQAIERRAAGVAAYMGPSPFLLLAASIAIASVLSALVGLGIRLVGGDPESPLATLLLLAVIQATYIGLTRMLVVGTGALSWADMGVRSDVRRGLTDLAWGASFALPVIGLTLIVAAVVSAFVSAVPESPLPPTGTAPGLILNLIGGAILVPIGEEVLFRGVSTTAWVRVYGPSRAIVQGALFFAVVHVLQVGGTSPSEALALAFVAFATRVPVALALGWLFVARRSLWASVGLHAAFNGILLVLAEVARGAGGAST
jgi:membrane protease YdiL (CAAX protease family)